MSPGAVSGSHEDEVVLEQMSWRDRFNLGNHHPNFVDL